MQDLEFTIQEGKLWMLQTRNGKRTGAAMVRIAMEMLQQGMIDEKTALLRVAPDRLNELLHPSSIAPRSRAPRIATRPAGLARRGHRPDRLLCRRSR
jgi:phosphoenolpyruvate synthase/pyruvate phosphate dikinase